MITEDYVSFEIAKLLKEKGFDEATYRAYIETNKEHQLSFDAGRNNSQWEKINKENGIFNCSAPTLQMAMKWLREVHNIDISVDTHSRKEDKTLDYEFTYWYGKEYHTPYDEKYPTYHKLFGKTWEKYEEACEAATKYCLENLI